MQNIAELAKNIKFSTWLPYPISNRRLLQGLKFPGVYLISRKEEPPEDSLAVPEDKTIIYIGETKYNGKKHPSTSIQKRVDAFFNSGFYDEKSHAGGATLFHYYNRGNTSKDSFPKGDWYFAFTNSPDFKDYKYRIHLRDLWIILVEKICLYRYAANWGKEASIPWCNSEIKYDGE